MSEYQYYEFLAIDRPLDRAAQQALRAASSRARITATSFTNHYDWGDLKGNPREWMERWFDAHLYLTNWGTRRLMMKLPSSCLDPEKLRGLLGAVDWVDAWTSGDSTIVDFFLEDIEGDGEFDDGPGRLAALAPLRADVLSGDLRVLYLAWLAGVQWEVVADDVVEPLPGIGPLTGALEAFAEFFDIDPDLVQVAAESGAGDETSREALRDAVESISERDKTELLLRLVEGDVNVAAELKRRIRKDTARSSAARRTARALRMRAGEIAEARERAEAARREAERRREAKKAEKARRVRIDVLKRRGESVWREIEEEIERRNPAAYERAMVLLADLQVIAAEQGRQDEFSRRLAAIHTRHEKKGKFIERLNRLRSGGDGE